MHTTINANGDITIVEETRDGSRFLVAQGVPIVRPQVLSNGYVPEDSVRSSVELENTHGTTGWTGTTATLNHPLNVSSRPWYDPTRPEGEPVLAANDHVQRELGLGELENDRWDGEYIRVDLAVNADRAEDIGGEALDVVDALENDERLEVSTQFVGAELPPGEYDGEHRAQAEAIVAPDGLALLPNGKGKCSVDGDGCGIAGATAPVATATANGQVVHLQTGHAGGSGLSVSANTTHDPVWSGLGGVLRRVASDFNDLQEKGILADNDRLRKVAIDINEALGMWRAVDRELGGDGELPERTEAPERATVNADALSREALIQKAATGNQDGYPDTFPFDDVTECTQHMAGRVEDEGAFCSEWVREVKGEEPAANAADDGGETDSESTAGAESPADTTTNAMERDTLIEAIVEQSNIKRESLDGMGDSCLETTHQHIVADGGGSSADIDDGDDDDDDGADADADAGDAGGDTDGSVDVDPSDVDADDDGVVVANKADLQDMIDERVEQRVSEEQQRRSREERVDRIVANSAEYEADDKSELMETPESVLERIERGLAAGTEFPAASGPTVNAGGSGEDDVDLDELGVEVGRIDR